MTEPQQQGTDEFIQHMDPDLSSCSVDLLKEITRHMDNADRSDWRLVNKAACQAVYDSTTALAPCMLRNTVADRTAALLPQLLVKCSGLKQLQLACYQLAEFNYYSGALQLPLGMEAQLEALDISYTDVKELSFVARCTSLKRLTAVYSRAWVRQDSRQLAALLQQLPRLSSLRLRNNELRVDAARDVAAALQNLTGLEELDIRGTRPDAAAVLVAAVPCPERLQFLGLSRCLRVPRDEHVDGLAALPAALQLTRHVQHLDLSSNDLQADRAAVVARVLRGLTQLKGLNLSDNSGNKRWNEGISALAPAIQQLTGLTSLDLSRNGFGAAGAAALAPALGHLTRLQDLDLASTAGPEGAALLAPALQELTGLLRLDLSSMGLDAEALAALAPALQRLTMLQHLDLSYNDLGPDGVQALLPSIQQLVSLRSLDLRRNAMDVQSALRFAAGMHQPTRLEQLHLSRGDVIDLDEVELALAGIAHTAIPGCKISLWRD